MAWTESTRPKYRRVVEELLARGHTVVGLDNFSKYGRVSKSFDGHCNYQLMEGDARDVALLTGLLVDRVRRRPLLIAVNALTGAAVLLLLAAGVVAALPPLRARVVEKVLQARRGDWNSVLTGRLDGWRAAAWMLGEHPWAG
ncbi:hypothetical protein B4Q13_18885, partial [Lacticaseibacillus rhamnosus]